jgi:acetylornithine deacetylase
MRRLFPFVRRLIDIPSITGREGDVARFVERHLTEEGFQTELHKVEGDRFNVFARVGGQPRVVFCTHLDTVPPHYSSSEDDGFIYGRGACDAKGILGAMVVAFELLRDGGADGLGLLFVVGEELDSVGAKAANGLDVTSDYLVVGEPTENRLASGHRGTFKFVLRADGKAAHSAYPHLGDSAIERLVQAMGEIRRTNWGESDILGKATVNFGTISGGLAANIIAPSAEAQIYVRVVGKADAVKSKLEDLLKRDSKLSYELIARNDAVFCEVLPDFEVAPVAFGTDIPSLQSFGKPLLVGPGSIRDAHTDHEKIGKLELEEAVSLYCRIARTLLGRKD